MKKTLFCLAVLFGFGYFCVIGHSASDDFFKGKSIRLIVGNSPGGAQDDWARFLAQHLSRNISGNPDIIVQNMGGAGGVIAANYVYNVAKPDGLTLGFVNPAIYIDQLIGAKEVKFDYAKFTWIGSPEQIDQVLFMRSDVPHKTIDALRNAPEPPRCAALARAGLGYFLPRLLDEALGIKLNMVLGYGGGGEMNLAIEKNEVQCRAGTVSAYVGREPTRTWMKNGFVHALVQSGEQRYAKLPDVPTIYELMNTHKTAEETRRLARVLLSSGDLGRPIISSPGVPAERIRLLREGFTKAMKDPALLADANKRKWDLEPTPGDRLEATAKEVVVQPREVIEKVKKLLEQ